MNGLLGRTRRVLAGLVSAMMVLTSLPLTEVAVYAAPSGNAASAGAVVEEASDAADAADVAVADVDEEAEAEAADAAVADEADDTAAPDEDAKVTVSFDRGEETAIESVKIGDRTYTFASPSANTVSANVSQNVAQEIEIEVSVSENLSFVYAVDDGGVALERVEDDPYYCFSFTPEEETTIHLNLKKITVSAASPLTATYTAGVEEADGKNYIKPGEVSGVVFELTGISDKYLSPTVIAKAGETELEVIEGTDNYTLSKAGVETAAFIAFESTGASNCNIEISVDGPTYTTDRIHPNPNEDLKGLTEDRDSLVSENSVVYVKRDTDYRFKATLTPASVSAGKIVSRVSYQIGTNTPVKVTADDDGWYTIPKAHILTAAQQDKDINIDFVTAAAKQNVNFKVAGNGDINKITYGPTNGDENSVSMDEAKKTTGATVSVNSGEDQKMIVTLSSNSLLLSDSVKIGGEAVSAEGEKYLIPVNEESVDVAVEAYKKVKVVHKAPKSKDGKVLTSALLPNGVEGIPVNPVTTGEAIRFISTLAPGLEDYDAKLEEPEIYYGTGNAKKVITPEGSLIAGYTIKKEDVEAAIKAGEDIIIEAKATEIPKATITFKKTVATTSNNVVDVQGFKLTEVDPSTGNKVKEHTISSAKWTESGNTATAELPVQAGNKFIISNLQYPSQYVGATFTKIKKGDTEIRQKEFGSYELGSVAKDTEFTIETATLKGSEISYKPASDPDGLATTTMSFLDGWILSNGYVNVSDSLYDFGGLPLKLVVDDSNDPIYARKLKDVQYTATDGSKGDVAKTAFSSFGSVYYLPVDVLQKAAFATAVSDNKITVTAELEKAGTKPQSLFLVGNSSIDAEVKQNGVIKSVDSYTGAYGMEYGKAATVTVAPEAGFALDKAYLIKQADLKSAGLNPNDTDYPDKILEKVTTASSNKIEPAAEFKAGNDGKIKANIKKVDGAYTLFVTTKAKTELVIYGERTGVLEPFKKDNYSVYWWETYHIYYLNGSSSLTISGNTVSANNGEKAVTAEVFESSYEPIGEYPTSLTFAGTNDDVNGREITVKFDTVDGKKQQLTFYVSKKLKAGDIRFKNVTLSDNKINETQTLGTTKKYTIENNWGVPLEVKPENSSAIECRLVDKKEKGVIVGHELYVTSHAVQDLTQEIKFYDATCLDPSTGYIRTVEVPFDTNQVKNADLSGLKASADTDSITVNFSKAKGFDKTTEGLYYKVTYSTSEETEVLSRGNASDPYYAPATDAFATVPLTYNPEEVEPTSISYNVIVELVQRDKSAAPPQTIATSAKSYTASVETIADGVYAKKITLKKAKTAPKVIYGSSDGKGMGEFHLATVQYPKVGKTPVTVKRLKQLELINSNGVVVDDLDKDNGYIDLDQYSQIYLNPKDLAAGKYTVKAYAVEPKGADVAASMKVTVANAINELEVNVPSNRLYKAPGKAATVKATVTYNDGDKTDKPKTKKVKWSLTDTSGDPLSVPGVSIKAGKVTIAKNAVLPEDLEFCIVAEAADFDHGTDPVKDSTTIGVMTTVQTPAEIFISGTKVTKNAQLKSSVFNNDFGGEVSVLDTNDNSIDDFSWSATGAMKKWEVDENTGVFGCFATKLGKASIKVTTADGSKKSLKIPFTVVTDTGINGAFGSDDTHHEFDSSASEYSFTNNEDPTAVLYLGVCGDDEGIVDHSVKFDGFKKVKVKSRWSPLEQGLYYLAATKRNAKITITEKKTRKTTVINVTNTKIPESSKAAATKITASNKVLTTVGKAAVDNKGTIFTGLDFYYSLGAYQAYKCNKVTYTVKYGKTAAVSGDVVRLYTDKYNGTDWMGEHIVRSGGTYVADGIYDVTLGAGGTFDIDYFDVGNREFKQAPGTYKFRVVPVNDKGEARYKATTVKVKIVKTPKPTVKTLKAKPVKFNGSVSANSLATLEFAKQGNIFICETSGTEYSSAQFGAEGAAMDVRGLNVKGKINGFAEMFTVENGQLKYTGKRSSFYNTKKGISGQIAVSYTGMDGRSTYMYIPITVTGDFR